MARNARNQPDATYATVRRPLTIARPANRTNVHVLDARNARASFYLIARSSRVRREPTRFSREHPDAVQFQDSWVDRTR